MKQCGDVPAGGLYLKVTSVLREVEVFDVEIGDVFFKTEEKVDGQTSLLRDFLVIPNIIVFRHRYFNSGTGMRKVGLRAYLPIGRRY